MVTSKYFNSADTWLNVPHGSVLENDHISDPFDVVINHHKSKKTNTTRSSPHKPNPISASEGDSYTPSQAEQLSETSVNSFAMPGTTLISAQPRSDKAGVFTDTFGNSNPNLDKKSYDTNKESLKIPIIQNPHDNVLRRSPSLQEQRKK